MKRIIIVGILIAMSACSNGPAKFAGPSSNAKTWDLNVGKWPGTNKLIQGPSVVGAMR